MKKYLYLLLVFCGLLTACSDDEPAKENTNSQNLGSIYGLVTDSETAEPIRGASIKLYILEANLVSYTLTLSTVTYDDGHFEFKNLEPNKYKYEVSLPYYDNASQELRVMGGQTSKVDISITKTAIGLNVATKNPIIDGMKVTFNGNVSSTNDFPLLDCGFYYGKNSIPREDWTMIKSQYSYEDFSVSINHIDPGTYYFQAFATNKIGTAYGDIMTFTIDAIPGNVKTLGVTANNSSSTTLAGEIISAGEPQYTEKGFVVSHNIKNPAINDDATLTKKYISTGESTAFSSVITDLEQGEKYYARAFITNAAGTSYGDVIIFTAGIGSDWYEIDNIAIQKTDISNGTTWNNAVSLCANSNEGGFKDWRLPTLEEAYFLYDYGLFIGLDYYNYWTSTIDRYYSYPRYYVISMKDGYQHLSAEGGEYHVRCIRKIN